MLDEWQAQQAIPAILQVSSSKHNAKIQEEEARFISRGCARTRSLQA